MELKMSDLQVTCDQPSSLNCFVEPAGANKMHYNQILQAAKQQYKFLPINFIVEPNLLLVPVPNSSE